MADPTYKLTVYHDGNITGATAAKTTGIAKDEEVLLTITPATGKVLDDIVCISGGATVNLTTKKVKIGEADAVVYVTGRKDMSGTYIVTEDVLMSVNSRELNLKHNTLLKMTQSGALYAVETGGGTDIDGAWCDIVPGLVAAGVLKPAE